MDSDDDFMDHGSGGELRAALQSPEPQGMAKRTRLRAPETALKGASGAYAWEDEYQRTWDVVKEDGAEGRSLEQLVQHTIEQRKQKIMKHAAAPFQRGIIRTLVVVLDGLRTMLDKDLRPTRFACLLALLQDFVAEFFDQNPVAQMGIVVMRNGVAAVLSEVSGLPQHHLDRIRAAKARQHNRWEPKGDPLLQNALELARLLLGPPPPPAHAASREVLLIFGALFTLDPGDIHATIAALAREHVRVKAIGLLAHVAVCQELVRRTNAPALAGPRSSAALDRFYGVIMNEHHFRELLMDCVEPLAVPRQAPVAGAEAPAGVPLLRMGFPLRRATAAGAGNFPALCACHPTLASAALRDAVDVRPVPLHDEHPAVRAAYTCPQCRSTVCLLPAVCPVCGLMLILSTHLARLYHHLVPLAAYADVPVAPTYASSHCYGCLLQFPEGTADALALALSSRYRCAKCSHDFCIDCDVFVHEFLHNCPGCENGV